MESYTVRIRRWNDTISTEKQTFSQLCRTLMGAPYRLPEAFWRGEESVETAIGNVKLINMDRLNRSW